jgi:hypothetical protein
MEEKARADGLCSTNNTTTKQRERVSSLGIDDIPAYKTPCAQYVGEKKHRLVSSNEGTRNGWNCSSVSSVHQRLRSVSDGATTAKLDTSSSDTPP